MQHQGFPPAQNQRNHLVEEQMADGGLRRTRQRPAPDVSPVARNQEVALIVALIKEPKQVIFAAIGEL